MNLLHLLAILALSAADVVRADAAESVNAVVDDFAVHAYMKMAEGFLEFKSHRESNLDGDDTVKLLKQFIEVGKSIEGRDCSEHSLELIQGLPIKSDIGFSGWEYGVQVFKTEYGKICPVELRGSKKQLHL